MSTYVCSDIHGQKELFDRMLGHIGFGKRDRMYILGDLIDRGPDGIALMKAVMDMPNVTCLLGNHELMMLDYINRGDDIWLDVRNGGTVTCREFARLSTEEQNKIIDYIGDMYLQVEIPVGDYKFLLSHSSFIRDKGTVKWKNVDDTTVFRTVWYSPWRFFEWEALRNYAADGRTHIIGHVPVQRASELLRQNPGPLIDHEYHLINIDLGCAMLGAGDTNEKAGICCMNLTKYAEGNEEGFFCEFGDAGKKTGEQQDGEED